MFVLKRCLRGMVTLWLVVTVVFLASRFSGDPTFHLIPINASEEQRRELRVQLGLDQPLTVQYLKYLSGLVQGRFGLSFFTLRPVVEEFAERLPNTLKLTAASFCLSVLIGLPIGIICALKRNRPVDRLLMSLSFIGQATPDFALGIALILIFSLGLQLLPSGGSGGWSHFIMPVVTLGTATAASISRLVRSSMLDVLNQDYIRFARSKGLGPVRVVLKHGLRNALPPVLTIVGLQVGTLIAGAVVVETVFSWSGVGRLLVTAVLERDFPLLQFGVLALASTVIAANTLVDLSYSLLDPRVRAERLG